jgi:transmembrane sensor
MKTLPQDSAAEEQASLWAARIEGSHLTAEARAELDAWLAERPSHRTLLSQYCQFSADLEKTLPVLVRAGALDMPAVAAPEPVRRRSGWPMLNWFAGGALAAAATAAIIWVAWPAAKLDSIAVPAGQRGAVTLADGSRVELNARTSIQVEIGAKERRVRLADGEAFFTVAKDPSRPFIVQTPAGSVRVTGTVFNVRSESAGQLEVIVSEGSVQVRPGQEGAAPYALTPRDRLSFTAATGVTTDRLSPSELEDALAWREGRIVFAGTPVRAALERFARYHGVGIAVSTTVDATGHTFGAIYPIDDLDGFLSSIELTFPDLQVTHENNGTVRVSVRRQ